MQLSATTPEQRQHVYEDVRSLLSPGFLIHHVAINGARLVLRSLSDDDWFILRTRTWGAQAREWKAWLVSTAVWMVDGQLILNDGDSSYRLFEMCLAMPHALLDDMEMLVTALMTRVSEAAHVVEAFMYEDESRLLWKSQGGARPETTFHGEVIGSNPVRRIWAYFNQYEDQRDHTEYLWSLSKFLTSPHAPKGVKKLQAQDQKNKTEEKRRRQQVMDRIYYEAAGLVPRVSAEERRKGVRGPWQDVHMAETPEELQEVMRRWVLGIKDDHDRIVEGAKDRIRKDVEARKAKALAQREALDAALEEEGISGNALVPIAGKAGQEFLDRVRSRIPGTSKVFQNQTHNSAYEKYIAKDANSGNLVVDDDGRVMSTQPTNPEMVNMMVRPESPGQSLQERVTQRRPTASFHDDE